jgi:hypothetical protein
VKVGDTEFYGCLGDPRGPRNISEGDWTADGVSASDLFDEFLACANYHPEDHL